MADDLRGFKPEELAIRVCESPNSMSGSAHVGIEIALSPELAPLLR